MPYTCSIPLTNLIEDQQGSLLAMPKNQKAPQGYFRCNAGPIVGSAAHPRILRNWMSYMGVLIGRRGNCLSGHITKTIRAANKQRQSSHPSLSRRPARPHQGHIRNLAHRCLIQYLSPSSRGHQSTGLIFRRPSTVQSRRSTSLGMPIERAAGPSSSGCSGTMYLLLLRALGFTH